MERRFPYMLLLLSYLVCSLQCSQWSELLPSYCKLALQHALQVAQSIQRERFTSKQIEFREPCIAPSPPVAASLGVYVQGLTGQPLETCSGLFAESTDWHLSGETVSSRAGPFSFHCDVRHLVELERIILSALIRLICNLVWARHVGVSLSQRGGVIFAIIFTIEEIYFTKQRMSSAISRSSNELNGEGGGGRYFIREMVASASRGVVIIRSLIAHSIYSHSSHKYPCHSRLPCPLARGHTFRSTRQYPPQRYNENLNHHTTHKSHFLWLLETERGHP